MGVNLQYIFITIILTIPREISFSWNKRDFVDNTSTSVRVIGNKAISGTNVEPSYMSPYGNTRGQ